MTILVFVRQAVASTARPTPDSVKRRSRSLQHYLSDHTTQCAHHGARPSDEYGSESCGRSCHIRWHRGLRPEIHQSVARANSLEKNREPASSPIHRASEKHQSFRRSRPISLPAFSCSDTSQSVATVAIPRNYEWDVLESQTMKHRHRKNWHRRMAQKIEWGKDANTNGI